MSSQHCVNCGTTDGFLIIMKGRDRDYFACLDCMASMLNDPTWLKIRNYDR